MEIFLKLGSLVLWIGILSLFSFTLNSKSAFSQGGLSVEAGGGGSISDGFLVGSHVFFFSDNSTVGAETLNDGSAVLLRTDLQYNFADWFTGFGLFYETDTYGGLQKDTITGFIVELYLGNFYLKIMPGSIKQEFTDRSFSQRIGSFTATEFGIRAALISDLAFYEFAIQQRTKSITKEDDREMAAPFEENQLFPILGIGISI